MPIYDFTTDLASFGPPQPESMALFEALARQPEEVDRLLGAITGSTPLDEYLSPGNLVRILGIRAMAGIVLRRLRQAPGGNPRRARPSRSTRAADLFRCAIRPASGTAGAGRTAAPTRAGSRCDHDLTTVDPSPTVCTVVIPQ